MRRIGVPRGLVSLLEGESLVNDATALVVFQMSVAASAVGGFSLGGALVRFVWAAAGGVADGLAAGWVVVRIRRWLDRSDAVDVLVESTVSLLAPYAAFIPADRLGVSGVLAVVALGLYTGRSAPRILSPQPRLQATQLWEMLNFVLEGLIFILVGLGLPLALAALVDTPIRTLVVAAALVSAVVIVVRLVGVASIAYLPHGLVRRVLGQARQRTPWREVAFAGWAGLRGGMSLVVALSLPLTTASGTPFPGRDLVVFLTFAVILVTLVGQGLTLAGVIRWLDLRPDESAADEEATARLQATRAGLARLEQLVARDGVPEHSVDAPVVRSAAEALREQQTHRAHRYAARAGRVADEGDDGIQDEAIKDARRAHVYRWLRLAMIDAERRELVRLRDERTISDGVLRRVQHDLDLEQTLLETDGAR
jgi:CPA1 family monovalent cation:H+ antiporter